MRRHLKAGHLVVALHIVGVGHVEVGGGGVDVHVHVYRAGVEADWTGKQYFSMTKVSFQKIPDPIVTFFIFLAKSNRKVKNYMSQGITPFLILLPKNT